MKQTTDDRQQTTDIEIDKCPLCSMDRCESYHLDKQREYLCCPRCKLIHVPSKFHLSPKIEKDRYDHHKNNPEDPEYRKFLSKLMDPILERIPADAEGLDFGSGPGPTLSVMFGERGYRMSNYDPIYSNDKSVLNKAYDFVTCSETVEHFCHPRNDWDLLFKLVKPCGHLGIMTQMYDGKEFSDWHYIRDDTHVSFYSRETFWWLADRYDAKYEMVSNSVVIFRTIKN